jgi:teichuronic acid biosynthesis glycosyltransferase TuaG
MVTPLVSIIVPCYNAQKYISQTINSILNQKHTHFEIIIIDDGSFDKSKDIINQFNDSRVHYFFQANKGVSSARNIGFSKAKGEFVVFFDADDLMSENFLTERLSVLKHDSLIDFSCSQIKKIDELNNIIGNEFYNGYTNTFSYDILTFNQRLTTCPSNYLFRISFLLKNKITFNENLASTADKFFLLKCNNVGKGYQIKESAFLLYRVSSSGMSQVLNINLINDNIQFEKETLLLLKSNGIQKKVIDGFLAKNRLSISISFFKIKVYNKTFIYLFKSLICNPKVFVNYLLNKLE